MRPLLVLAAFAALALPACATYQDDLARAQHAYEGSEDERALAIFRMLEPDTGRLSVADRAHYDYLRGMTDFRIGYQNEARHWLSLADAIEQQTPGSLPPDWAKRMTDSLKELNEEVYTAGIQTLSNTASPKAKSDTDSSPDADTDPSKKPSMPPSD